MSLESSSQRVSQTAHNSAAICTHYGAGQIIGSDSCCFDRDNLLMLAGERAQLNKCLSQAVERSKEIVENIPKWYDSKTLWFAIGAIVGGAAVGFAVSR